MLEVLSLIYGSNFCKCELHYKPSKGVPVINYMLKKMTAYQDKEKNSLEIVGEYSEQGFDKTAF